MLTKLPFYFQTTRNLVICVGSLFSNIFCVTKDTNNVTQKIVVVPLAYAPKEKFVVRLQQDPSLNEDLQINLPRMSYEIVDTTYDGSRQLNKLNKVTGTRDGNNVFSYAPVPYNLTFKLYSYTRTQDDNLQILEQIVPYFTPDMNLSVKIMQNPDVTQDCQLILESVNTDDRYDGAFEDRRYIITTYSFVLKMNYYGPVVGKGDPEHHFAPTDKVGVIKSVNVNLNTNKYSVTINPFDAKETDPHSLNAGWSSRDKLTDFDQNRIL